MTARVLLAEAVSRPGVGSMGGRQRMRGIMIGSILTCLALLQPSAAQAQANVDTGASIEGNAGPVLLGLGPCGQESAPGFSAGIEVRSRGPWVVSAGLDLMLPGIIRTLLEDVGCISTQPVTRVGGEWADVVGGGASHPLIRLGVGFGRAFPELPLAPELSAGAGLIPTNTYFGWTAADPDEERTDFSWEPWFGGRLRIATESHPVGLRIEAGRHRLRKRFYAQNEERLLAEVHHWPWMLGAAISVPIRR